MFSRHRGSRENVTPSGGSRGRLASSRGPAGRPRPQAGPQAPQPAGLQIVLQRRLQRKGLRNQTLDRLTPPCSQGQTPAQENLRDSGMIAQNYILNPGPWGHGSNFPKTPNSPEGISLCSPWPSSTPPAPRWGRAARGRGPAPGMFYTRVRP